MTWSSRSWTSFPHAAGSPEGDGARFRRTSSTRHEAMTTPARSLPPRSALATTRTPPHRSRTRPDNKSDTSPGPLAFTLATSRTSLLPCPARTGNNSDIDMHFFGYFPNSPSVCPTCSQSRKPDGPTCSQPRPQRGRLVAERRRSDWIPLFLGCRVTGVHKARLAVFGKGKASSPDAEPKQRRGIAPHSQAFSMRRPSPNGEPSGSGGNDKNEGARPSA